MKQSWRQASMQVLNSSVARPWKLEQNTSGQASRQALRASRLWKLEQNNMTKKGPFFGPQNIRKSRRAKMGLPNPRVTMRHKISYSYKTMFANCRIPNGHWKTLMPYCSRTPCRRNQRARLQSHTHGLLLPKESAHPCRSSSQCNRTCSQRPTAAAHASERTTLLYRGPQHS